MVPKHHWAAILILAAIMEPDFQAACDEHGFIWVRTYECDVRRPHPSFPEDDEVHPTTREIHKVRGDGNIDVNGEITSRPFGYIVCTMHEIHEACDTLVVRQGNVSSDTFVCFTARYPSIFFQKNKIPKTSHQVVVKFDTWTAYRAGAMAYRTSANQWALTTGLPVESVRDHIGNCFDLSTVTTLEWAFLPITPEEPETTLADMIQGQCVMPSCERWHCVLTTQEKATSVGMHLFDWQLYQNQGVMNICQRDVQKLLLQKRPLFWLNGQEPRSSR